MTDPGRDRTTGRFLKGCKGGPGAPQGTRRQVLSTAFYEAVTPKDVKAIVTSLIFAAKKGDGKAAQLILDRFVAKMPPGMDLSDENLEKLDGIVHLDFKD